MYSTIKKGWKARGFYLTYKELKPGPVLRIVAGSTAGFYLTYKELKPPVAEVSFADFADVFILPIRN